MKKFLTFIMASGFVVLMNSCGSSRNAASLSSIGGEWDVTEINGSPVKVVEGQDAPFMGFDVAGKLVYGSAGCNRLTGGLNADAKTGKINFGALGSTRMMCHDMTNEDNMLRALGDVTGYEVKADGTMTLNNDANKVLVVLKKRAR